MEVFVVSTHMPHGQHPVCDRVREFLVKLNDRTTIELVLGHLKDICGFERQLPDYVQCRRRHLHERWNELLEPPIVCPGDLVVVVDPGASLMYSSSLTRDVVRALEAQGRPFVHFAGESVSVGPARSLTT